MFNADFNKYWDECFGMLNFSLHTQNFSQVLENTKHDYILLIAEKYRFSPYIGKMNEFFANNAEIKYIKCVLLVVIPLDEFHCAYTGANNF